jgi:hypothetical protein
MINLIAGGKSVLNAEIKDGLKVYLNFAFEYFDDIDILIWGDQIVGDKLFEKFNGAASFKTVCHRTNGGKYKNYVNDSFEFPKGRFTLVWALYWLKENYPDEIIVIYGLDGDGESYYDSIIKQPDIEKRINALTRCYSELDQIEDRENIYVAKGSSYKGFPEINS